MSDELVERLRAHFQVFRACASDVLTNEVADRIEALEADLSGETARYEEARDDLIAEQRLADHLVFLVERAQRAAATETWTVWQGDARRVLAAYRAARGDDR